MAKHDRALPSHSGFRYRSFWSSVASAGACAGCPRRVLGVEHERADAHLGRLGGHAAIAVGPSPIPPPLRGHVREPEAPVLAGSPAEIDDGGDQLLPVRLVGLVQRGRTTVSMNSRTLSRTASTSAGT